MPPLTPEEIKKIEIATVLERLKAIPEDMMVLVGSGESADQLTIGELAEKIKADDPLGAEIVRIQMNYLRRWQTKAGKEPALELGSNA